MTSENHPAVAMGDVFNYQFESKLDGVRVFIMPSGVVGIERDNEAFMLTPAEWFERVSAWTAEHMSATLAVSPPNQSEETQWECSDCGALFRKRISDDPNGRCTRCVEVSLLEAEVARLREALIRWHKANGSMDFASADEYLAALAAALATPAGEGRDG